VARDGLAVITILAVGHAAEALAVFGAEHPSIEVVTADGAEDALERLARNRRIDAVLILDPNAAETARLVREEDPGAPPLFAPATAGTIAGVRSLSGSGAPELLDELLRTLGPE